MIGRRLTWKQLTQQTVELYQKVKNESTESQSTLWQVQ
ncbi:MAG: hypothetical protein M2R45_05468 [Verrucomicrobia subdivision 3 bacterium]|nr:hypothetical protein [Limisphaerales bacterium]MCS1417893.1 hypothetical protein [Limisphaerales bacterium]